MFEVRAGLVPALVIFADRSKAKMRVQDPHLGKRPGKPGLLVADM
jgi:hypothetical protein